MASSVDPAALLRRSHVVAVVGCSADPSKAAHRIPAQLISLGYDVIPVNPRVTEVLGRRAVATLGDIDRHVDIVDVFRPADEAPDIARQAVAIGADGLWLQLGIRSSEAAAIAATAEMDYVEDSCIGVVAARL